MVLKQHNEQYKYKLYGFEYNNVSVLRRYTCTCTQLERASQEEHNDANFSFIAPSSEEL